MVVDDLNLASIAIDASAKIYALRVDDLHQDIVRLASGLSSNFKCKYLINYYEIICIVFIIASIK